MSHARREQEDNSGESCDECNLKYSNPSDLRNHIRIVHIAKNKPVVTEKNNEEIQDEKTEDSSRMMVDSIMEDIFINLIQENESIEVKINPIFLRFLRIQMMNKVKMKQVLK